MPHKFHHLITLSGLLGLFAAGALGCPPALNQVCEPGRVADCACPGGGKGTQTCESGGYGWGPCECDEGDDDDDDNDDATPPPDDDDATPPPDDDDDGGVYLTVANYTSYNIDLFWGGNGGAWYDLLGYGYIAPGYEFTSEYYIWPGYWDLYVEDVTGYWASASCPYYLAAGQECYWDVYDWDMQP